MKPLVSVIVNIDGEKEFLDESLKSVAHQTLKNIEIICLDAGTNEKRSEALHSFAQNDPRFKVVKSSSGVSRVESINDAITHLVRADYVAFLEVGDIYFLDKLERQYHYFAFWPGVLAVGSQFQLKSKNVDHEVKAHLPQSKSDIFKIPHKLRFCVSSLVLNKAAFISMGGFKTEFIWHEAYDLLLRLSLVGDVLNVPLSLVRYNVMTSRRFLQLRHGDYYHYKALHLYQNASCAGDTSQCMSGSVSFYKKYLSVFKYSPVPGHLLFIWLYRNKSLVPFFMKALVFGGFRVTVYLLLVIGFHTLHYISWRLRKSAEIYYRILRNRST